MSVGTNLGRNELCGVGWALISPPPSVRSTALAHVTDLEDVWIVPDGICHAALLDPCVGGGGGLIQPLFQALSLGRRRFAKRP